MTQSQLSTCAADCPALGLCKGFFEYHFITAQPWAGFVTGCDIREGSNENLTMQLERHNLVISFFNTEYPVFKCPGV